MIYLRTLLIIPFFFLLSSASAQTFGTAEFGSNNEFLPVDQAFQFNYSQEGERLTLRWSIADGYYLYQHRFGYQPEYLISTVHPLQPALEYHDEFFGEVFIYRDEVEITLTLNTVSDGDTLEVRYQGCADAGLCYPPTVKTIYLNQTQGGADPGRGIELQDFSTQSSSAGLSGVLQQDKLGWALLLFFALGVGLAFTPCVFPMYPIVAAIIGGQRGTMTAGRGFMLTLVYVQGMAITYTLLGILVSLAGMQYQSYMQHPVVLITLAVLFVILALGMFGVYNLQMPSSLQSRLNTLSQKQKGGAYSGVFIMGALSGLIASPCTTAPLSGALLFIAQSGDVMTGGAVLYALSIGMGVPLLIIGASGGKLLPRAGSWMNSVKLVFGLLLFAVALFLIERLIAAQIAAIAWIIFALVSVLVIGISLWRQLRTNGRLILSILLIGLFATVLVWQKPYLGGSYNDHLDFEPVSNLAEIKSVVSEAAADDQWVMLDLYADWCVACKELEVYTFSNSDVQQMLENTRVIQADVTRTNATNTAILTEYQVLGLPTILFFNPRGEEVSQARVTGFMNADDFAEHLRRLKNR